MDGKKLAGEILQECKAEVSSIVSHSKMIPQLVLVKVGFFYCASQGWFFFYYIVNARVG